MGSVGSTGPTCVVCRRVDGRSYGICRIICYGAVRLFGVDREERVFGIDREYRIYGNRVGGDWVWRIHRVDGRSYGICRIHGADLCSLPQGHLRQASYGVIGVGEQNFLRLHRSGLAGQHAPVGIVGHNLRILSRDVAGGDIAVPVVKITIAVFPGVAAVRFPYAAGREPCASLGGDYPPQTLHVVVDVVGIGMFRGGKPLAGEYFQPVGICEHFFDRAVFVDGRRFAERICIVRFGFADQCPAGCERKLEDFVSGVRSVAVFAEMIHQALVLFTGSECLNLPVERGVVVFPVYAGKQGRTAVIQRFVVPVLSIDQNVCSCRYVVLRGCGERQVLVLPTSFGIVAEECHEVFPRRRTVDIDSLLRTYPRSCRACYPSRHDLQRCRVCLRFRGQCALRFPCGFEPPL